MVYSVFHTDRWITSDVKLCQNKYNRLTSMVQSKSYIIQLPSPRCREPDSTCPPAGMTQSADDYDADYSYIIFSLTNFNIKIHLVLHTAKDDVQPLQKYVVKHVFTLIN